jgi:hypothetical protein
VSIVKLTTLDTNLFESPLFCADGTEAQKTALMCVDVVVSKHNFYFEAEGVYFWSLPNESV